MNLKQRQEIYKKLEKQLGRDNQITKAIEEMAELIKELTKHLGKDQNTHTNNVKICEEIGDAKVSIEQLERFFDPTSFNETVMDYKLKRVDIFYLND